MNTLHKIRALILGRAAAVACYSCMLEFVGGCVKVCVSIQIGLIETLKPSPFELTFCRLQTYHIAIASPGF